MKNDRIPDWKIGLIKLPRDLKRNVKIKTDDIEYIKYLRNKGFTYKQICDKTGFKCYAVYSVINDYDKKRPKRKSIAHGYKLCPDKEYGTNKLLYKKKLIEEGKLEFKENR